MAFVKVTLLTIFLIFCAFISVESQKKILYELNEDNWKDMLNDEWMVEFYAPWCPACKGLQPTWKEFGSYAKDLGIKVGQVDVTTSPGLSGRFMVTALPTIFHVLNGQFRQYKGTRDKESFISFITNKKWKQVEPVPSWKSPNSFQMSIVSSFFKLSQILRHIHNQLMEDFGLPTWGSYLIFALATIIAGALLGLILVCIIDLIYPPRPAAFKKPEAEQQTKKTDDKNSGDELADEEIKDDLLDDASQSEGEKNSGSDSEAKGDVGGDTSDPNSPKIKKRRARLAD